MKNIKKYLIILFSVITVLYGSTCHSQEKKKLTPEDYNLWHTLKMGVVSDDGTWASFSKLYENTADTLFLKNTANDFQYSFPAGHSEKITLDGRLFGFLKSGSLIILDTETGKQEEYSDVIRFEFTQDDKHIIYQSVFEDVSKLVIKDIKTGKWHSYEDVKEYSLNSKGNYLAMVQHNNGVNYVKLLHLSDLVNHTVLSTSINSEYQNLTWNDIGKSLAYYIFEKDKNQYTIDFIPNVEKPLNKNHLEPLKVNNFPSNVSIIKSKLFISDNASKVFFDTKPKSTVLEETSNVQIWKSSDKEIPPKSKINFQRWNVWLPVEDLVYEIEDDDLIVGGITDNQQKAILLDNSTYLPLYEFGDRYSDVYLMDLNTGTKKKILEKQLRVNQHIGINIHGDYLAYFKNNNWWSYSIKTDKHVCITKDVQSIFNKSKSDRLDNHRSYGFGGWTNIGQMIIYDQFDIWLFSPEGKKKQKLTNGVINQKRHRISTQTTSPIRESFFGFVSNVYNIKEDLHIRTLNTINLNEGFGIWNSKSGYKEILNKDYKIIYSNKIGSGSDYQFIESRFDVSPRIVHITKKGKQKVLAQANKHQNNFYWGKSELIYYESSNGQTLKGALFYPANYDSDKKYPMVVSIYENRSHALHQYVAPALKNIGGFNITNYVSDGYFVLLPDIDYIINKPGSSALDCVSSAIDRALEMASIDDKNLGLIGHSFGGFETTYIISQTNRFKTAVAGAGVTDLLSFYLDIDSSNLSNIERFESEQFRNVVPFTEPEFIFESPIMNVKSMNTPILLFLGGKDKMVKPSYNIKLFLALWRLKKDCTLLLYPDEEHSIINEKNQIDISLKIKTWFDSYLRE